MAKKDRFSKWERYDSGEVVWKQQFVTLEQKLSEIVLSNNYNLLLEATSFLNNIWNLSKLRVHDQNWVVNFLLNLTSAGWKVILYFSSSHGDTFNHSSNQNSLFDNSKLAICSILGLKVNFWWNCGDNSNKRVFIDDILHFIDKQNTVAYVDHLGVVLFFTLKLLETSKTSTENKKIIQVSVKTQVHPMKRST